VPQGILVFRVAQEELEACAEALRQSDCLLEYGGIAGGAIHHDENRSQVTHARALQIISRA
jgi:hypothetical protein